MFHTNLRLVVGEQPAITEIKVRIPPPGVCVMSERVRMRLISRLSHFIVSLTHVHVVMSTCCSCQESPSRLTATWSAVRLASDPSRGTRGRGRRRWQASSSRLSRPGTGSRRSCHDRGSSEGGIRPKQESRRIGKPVNRDRALN